MNLRRTNLLDTRNKELVDRSQFGNPDAADNTNKIKLEIFRFQHVYETERMHDMNNYARQAQINFEVGAFLAACIMTVRMYNYGA